MARKPAAEDNDSERPDGTGRPIWTGSISFGLVNVPVSLFSLEQKSEIGFKMLDGRDKANIKYLRVNAVSGKEVPWDQIVKGYEYSDENYVVLTKEDFENLALESLKTIDVQAFVPREQIDELYFEKPYVLIPKKKTEKGYVLLREVLASSGRVGIAKVAIRTREYLAALMPRGNALVVFLLRFAHELRQIDGYALPDQPMESYNITEREVKLAEQLVVAMEADWDPLQYKDDYREALIAWIDKKVESGGLTPKPGLEDIEEGPRESRNVIDLASLLSESVKNRGKEKKA
ncbi:MAG: Ku protein [Fimbriimonadaceae bacterium]|nr:Ku protein [Fimbriimonadaceae bacterium]